MVQRPYRRSGVSRCCRDLSRSGLELVRRNSTGARQRFLLDDIGKSSVPVCLLLLLFWVFFALYLLPSVQQQQQQVLPQRRVFGPNWFNDANWIMKQSIMP